MNWTIQEHIKCNYQKDHSHLLFPLWKVPMLKWKDLGHNLNTSFGRWLRCEHQKYCQFNMITLIVSTEQPWCRETNNFLTWKVASGLSHMTIPESDARLLLPLIWEQWIYGPWPLNFKASMNFKASYEHFICYCNVMAKGFQFMPLSLVRLRTFRLSTWVSWVQTLMWMVTRMRDSRATQRCHNSPKMTERGYRVLVTSCTGRVRRFVGDLKKVRELRLDVKWGGSTFGARRCEANLRPMGAARDGDQMNKTA